MKKFDIPRFKQTKNMCGPYALKTIASFLGDDLDVDVIKKEVKARTIGGTYDGPMLLFLKKRYKLDFVSNNLNVFDLSWDKLPSREIAGRIKKRGEFKKKYKNSYKAWEEYFSLGGKISFSLITKELIKKMIDKNSVVLTLLNSTFYNNKLRKYRHKPDDIRGNFWGHYLVIGGYDNDKFYIIDPGNSRRVGKYWISADHLIVSILTHFPMVVGVKK